MDTNAKAWIYTRIDAPEDAHGALKGQERRLNHYAEQAGYTVAGYSSDIGDGLSTDRPGLRQMMEAVQRGEFHILLVVSSSRLGQGGAVLTGIVRQLASAGVEALSMSEGRIGGSILAAGEKLTGGRRHA